MLYFADNALQVEFIGGLASFIGLANSELFEVCVYGINPFDTAARDVFQAIALREPQPHRYTPTEYLFPAAIITLYSADKQYDQTKQKRVIWGQIGLGNRHYLEAINALHSGA
jgi:hypothetical protein